MRIKLLRRPKCLIRGGAVSFCFRRQTQGVIALGVVRLKLGGQLELADSAVELLLFGHKKPEIIMRINVIRVEPQGRLQLLFGPLRRRLPDLVPRRGYYELPHNRG